MNLASIPDKFYEPFANHAGPGYINPIPDASQIGVNPGYASLHDGFVPLNATPVGAGGIPPRIQDWNGILYQVTAWNQWQAAGGPVFYDLGFATAVGGYPRGAVLTSNANSNKFWINQLDGNATDPDGGGAANWQDLFAPIFTNAEFFGTFDVIGAAVFHNTVNLGGNATATTQAPGDNTTKLATDAFVTAAATAAVTTAVANSRLGHSAFASLPTTPLSGSTTEVDTGDFVCPCNGNLLVVGSCNVAAQLPATGGFSVGIYIDGVDNPLASETAPFTMSIPAAIAVNSGHTVKGYTRLIMPAFGGAAVSVGLHIAYVFTPSP